MDSELVQNNSNSTQVQKVLKKVVILLHSEFQPIHNGHLKMMELARKRLIQVYGEDNMEYQGKLIPSNKSSLYFQYLDDDVRLRMISLAIKNTPWLTLDDSLVTKKAKSIKDITNKLIESLDQCEVYEVMSLDKQPSIFQNIANYKSQNIIFVEYRFTYEEEQLLDITKQINEIPTFELIRDSSDDMDIHSRVIRDIYNGGYDISLYVPPDITKFHKSQNIKYKPNLQSKSKDSTSKKTTKNTNSKSSKDNQDSKKENDVKKSSKNSKHSDQQEIKEVKKQEKPQQQQMKSVNIKSFIDFDFQFINHKDLSGFNLINDITNPKQNSKDTSKINEKEQTGDNEAEQEEEEKVEEQKQDGKDKNYLGSGLQARVLSMIYTRIENEVEKEEEVAVKMVKFSNQVSRRQATFYRDLRGLWQCRGHKNIVQVYGSGNTKDIGYIVLERCTKARFKNWILKYSPAQLSQNKYFMQLLTDLSDGCDFMAKHGILHRDFQINNILVKLKGVDQDKEDFDIEDVDSLKVSDFGVSAVEEDKENIVKGSTRHYSPESIEDKVNYTSKSDVFSFGALLYEIFYKRWVFPNCTVQEANQKTKSGELTPLDDTIPLQIQSIILNTWKFKPEERITFSELTNQLQEYTNTLKTKDISIQ